MKLMLILVLVCQAAPPDEARQDARQKREAARADQQPEWLQNVGRLAESFRSLGSWEEHYGYMIAAVEKVYERNGWDSEADIFSLDLIREVEPIPPWAFQERFDTFVGALSDRYLLDEEQERWLRQTLARESNAIFARHAARILQYAGEAIQTRAAGEAITPEQVARWAELAKPVFEDSRQALNTTAERFLERLDPEQQAIVRRDLTAANRRMDWIDQQRARWARGEWRASDWGIEDDPIQLAGQARAAAGGEDQAAAPARTAGTSATPASSRPAPPRADKRKLVVRPGDKDDPWARYVRAFIRKYKLNDAQQQRAWLVYGNIKAHGDRLRQRYARQIGSLRRRLRARNDERTQAALTTQLARRDTALARLFQQLKQRLERLPTSAQRRDAEPIDLEAPAQRGVDAHPSDGP